MVIRLYLGTLFRRKAFRILPSRYFMNQARATWVVTETDTNRIGIKLQFPNTASCQQCMDYLSSDVNVTVVHTNPTLSNELTILPHQAPEETIEEILTDLQRNEHENFTMLRRGHLKKRYKTMVEFGSPNIAKPLHMGHLRSAVLGHYVARIHKALNHDVYSFCFLGDWGTQFGLLQAGLLQWGKRESLNEALQEMSLSDLLEYYIRAVKEQETNAEFAAEARSYCAALENGESTATDVWKIIREKTVDHLNSVWSELDIHFDVVQGESSYTMQSQHTDRAMLLLNDADVIQTSPDGCKYAVVKLGQKSTTPESKIILVKSSGTSLYILRDISAAIHRQLEHQFDRMIYVVDIAQRNHFLALFEILRKVDVNKQGEEGMDHEELFKHVTFGRVHGQSTRSGTFSLLSDVIRDGTALMEINRAASPNTRHLDDPTIARKLAISSLIINYFKVRRNRDVDFDWTLALKSHGDTGVSLQYGHARLVSLIEKQSPEFLDDQGEMKYKVNYEYILYDPIALDLMLHLANFEDALWSSYNVLEPNILAFYLFRLRDKSSKALRELPVKNEEDKYIASTRFFLFLLSKNIIAYGLTVLGIQPLDQM